MLDSSLNRALQNISTLGLNDRCTIIESDVFDYTGKFDLIVSNLVLHNMGRTRFKAYRKIYNFTPEYFIIGDLFFHKNRNAIRYELSKIADLFIPIYIINVPEISDNYEIIALRRI